MDILERRKTLAIAALRRYDRVVVALSGGVDSAVLLALACAALGPRNVLAVTGVSASLPGSGLADARDTSARLDVAHETVRTHELQLPGYRANSGDRCYHCRGELFRVLGSLARERGYAAVAYGAIKDDEDDYRPGMRAAAESGAIAPLLEAGLGKADVRELAALLRIRLRDKPSDACLASRLPVGTRVTEERLSRVARAESRLKRLGFRQLRVRHHGEIARLELDGPGTERLADPRLRRLVIRAVKRAGFRFVTVDLEGYRSGSLNPLDPARDGGQ